MTREKLKAKILEQKTDFVICIQSCDRTIRVENNTYRYHNGWGWFNYDLEGLLNELEDKINDIDYF